MKFTFVLIISLSFLFVLQAQQPKLVLPIGHTDGVKSISFSPDGKRIVSASADGTAKIWDATSGVMLADLKGHTNDVNSASFSPDGKKIVTSSWDSTAKIWDASSGVLLANLNRHTAPVYSASFSPDGKKIVTASYDSTAKIWDASSGVLLANLNRHTAPVFSASFSPDGKKIVTASVDSTAKIWDATSGLMLADLKGHTSLVFSASFSPDGKKIVTASVDSTAKIWDATSGVMLTDLKGHTSLVRSASFSPDEKKIVTASNDSTAKIWDATSGVMLADLKGHTDVLTSASFSPDGKKIVTTSFDNTAKIWDATSGLMLADLKEHISTVESASFSPDGKKIVTASDDHTAKIWDATSGVMLVDMKGHTDVLTSASFSPDGKKIVTASADGTAKIWDATSGVMLADFKGHTAPVVYSASFSPDEKKNVTTSFDTTAKVYATSGVMLADLKGHTGGIISAFFSPDGKKIVTFSWDSTAKIWDVASGAMLANLKGHTSLVTSASFSPDEKKIVTTSFDNTAKIWDAISGLMLADLKEHTSTVESASFSPDGKKIVTASDDHTAKIWDATSGVMLVDMKGHTGGVRSASFSPDEKKIVTASNDNTANIWDATSGKLLYTFFVVDSTDYLIVDAENHYDGTPRARKLLYYSCGTEVIGLDQVKDLLWVQNLAERINKGEKINAPILSELDICGLTPVVEPIENNTGYQFKITPRRGGLGETILYINGIETKKYSPTTLIKKGDDYELLVTKQELSKFFTSGKANEVMVKAYTKENDISSRGATITNEETAKNTTPPNLYAVIIGINDYKGSELHLNYAAKDASDIGNTVSISAGKFLGKEHVFIYNLNTGKEHYAYPEKKSIKDVFTEISKKATANDILMVFFAGHGVVKGEQKQFYFLTADASNATINDKDVKDVGISAAELMEWIKPDNIKAQKRIMILDACHSGLAINQIVSIGKDQNYLAARDDDKAEEIKQIDKLNEKAGLYILAASASNQSAYELGRYNQGLLTYCLLKAIKEHPEVLEENKYLNVSGWFNAATKLVTDIVRETNIRQEPQLITTTNFNVGIVDKDVLANIVLPDEKPMFTRSDFRNIGDRYDNRLSKLIDKEMSSISSRGSNSLTFIADYEGPDAYTLNGDYKITGNEINVTVIITKGSQKKYQFELKGKADDLQQLASKIVTKCSELVTR